MKKIFLGMAIAAGSMAFGQQFGVKAGGNFSNLSADGSISESKGKMGYYAGVFMNLPVAENFSIQPEVLYNNVGSKTTYQFTQSVKGESNLSLNYITVPVMIQYNFVPEFYMEAGPEVNFLVNAKSTTKLDTSSSGASLVKELNKDNFNAVNFGMGIGAGFNITPNFGINAKYVAGFNDITKTGEGKNKVNNIQFGASFKF